jgi:hypothetical protein
VYLRVQLCKSVIIYMATIRIFEILWATIQGKPQTVTSKSSSSQAVAVHSEEYVCIQLSPGIAGSNPAEGTDICLSCLFRVM